MTPAASAASSDRRLEVHLREREGEVREVLAARRGRGDDERRARLVGQVGEPAAERLLERLPGGQDGRQLVPPDELVLAERQRQLDERHRVAVRGGQQLARDGPGEALAVLAAQQLGRRRRARAGRA